jgi:hypothetical protein
MVTLAIAAVTVAAIGISTDDRITPVSNTERARTEDLSYCKGSKACTEQAVLNMIEAYRACAQATSNCNLEGFEQQKTRAQDEFKR